MIPFHLNNLAKAQRRRLRDWKWGGFSFHALAGEWNRSKLKAEIAKTK
jgi:hypothetical protein